MVARQQDITQGITTVKLKRKQTMAISYTWAVTNLKTKTEGSNLDAVIQTYWTKKGVDAAGNEGTFSGATPFTTTTMPANATFTPFALLTEEIVLSWIKAVAVGDYERHINEQIAKQIDGKINTVSEPAMPWAPPPSDPVAPMAPGTV